MHSHLGPVARAFLVWISGPIAGLALLTGCNTVKSTVTEVQRPAINCPEYFTLADGRRPSDSLSHNPLLDPRDGTRLELIRSAQAQGDYKVPEGKYGVGNDELLRIDSTTGRPLGIVPR